ncbi:MAG: hypothetical protein ACRD5K_16825 [Candidatus Acidiferrales bacterium]
MRQFNSKFITRFFGCLALAALMAFPALAATSSQVAPSDHPETASPGTINYVEGRARIGAETLSSPSVGKVALQAGQTLETENGRVEVLLTPGVFLRLGNDTSATMVSPSLTDTKVKIASGEATVEVDEYHSEQNLMIAEGDSTSYLVHTGLYDFVSQQGVVRVIKGQAVVVQNDHHVRVNSGQEVNLYPETARLKAKKFNVGQYKKEDPLYSWTKLRSQYLAEANVKVAPYLYGWNRSGLGWAPGWWGWYGPGWYWNPWFMSYTFVPGSGVIDSPFGWGFYSPWTFGFAPYSVYGGRIRHFNGGFDSWGMRALRHPNVSRRGRGFVHNGAGFPNRSFRGRSGGGVHGVPGGRR